MTVRLRRVSDAGTWAGRAHRFDAANVPMALCGNWRFSIDTWLPYDENDADCPECARLAGDKWEGER